MQQGTELVELQGTVVQGRGQAETIIHKGLLARAVALEHAAHLRHGDVGLVHEQDEILGEIVEQAGRRFPGLAAVQMAGIIFDAVAVAQLLDHLQLKLGPLLQTLRLHQAPAGLEGRQSFQQLLPDVGRGPLEVVLGGNEVTGRIDDGLAHFRQHVPGQGVHLAHGVDVIPKKFDAQGPLVMVSGDDLQHVPAHTEGPAMEVIVVTLVLDFHKTGDEGIHGHMLPHFHRDDHAGVEFGGAQAVDAGDRSHDDHIAPCQQGMGRGMAQFVDIVVDGRIFLDVGVRGGHIGFRLVVVVITDEILHSVLREKFAELVVELGGQRLVGGQHQRRASAAGNDIGHGEGLAGAGHAQQNLFRHAGFQIGHQGIDGLRLVTCGDIGAMELERRLVHHRSSESQPRAASWRKDIRHGCHGSWETGSGSGKGTACRRSARNSLRGISRAPMASMWGVAC